MHYVSVVIVPFVDGDTRETLSRKAEALLEPYSEHLEVEPYPVDCYCIGTVASSAGFKAAEAGVGKIDAYRERWWELPIDSRPAWEEFTAPWQEAKKSAEQAHPLYQKPDPDCEECWGTGQHMSTSNPKGTWDWHQLGGRWTGSLAPDYDPEQDPTNIETCWLCGGSGDRPDATYYLHTRPDGTTCHSTSIPVEKCADGGEIIHTEAEPVPWCNACDGKGQRAKWPTKWRDFEGDVAPVSAFREKRFIPYYVFTPDGALAGKSIWDRTTHKFIDTEGFDEFVLTIYERHALAEERYFGLIYDLHS